MPASRQSSSSWTYDYTGEPGTPPHHKQALAHSMVASEKFYGGSAGGGKTDWLLAEVLGPIWRYGIGGLILRRTFPQLNQLEGIIDRLRVRIPAFIGTYNAADHIWTFRNGGKLQLGFLRTDGDIARYMGGEFGVIGWDQLEQFTEYQFRRMRHPLRVSTSHPGFERMATDGFTPFMAATANPGGVGHAWVKGRFIDPAPPEVVWRPKPAESEPNPGTRVFISATIKDNPGLRGTSYEANLDNLDEESRRALKEGDWDVYTGNRFGSFRRAIHVVKPEDYPIPLSGGVVRATGIDYGSSAPFCCLWGALGPDNMVIVYRELYLADLTPTEQAEAILAAEAEEERAPGRPIPGYIDPSTWTRDPNVKASASPGAAGAPPRLSIAWRYQAAGVPVRKANNDRLLGVSVVAEALRVRKDGFPRLIIYSTCRNLIRTLPALPRSDRNPEDVDTDAEDHAYDALRYLCLGLGLSPSPAALARRGPQPPGRGRGVRSETAGLRSKKF